MKVTKENFISGPPSSSRPIHVYLSFKGDDESCKFTDRLWASLETDDLNTFWDDKKLETGFSSIPHHFLKAIQQSCVSIVVFSRNYASSIWCLEELSKIAERIHEPRYTILPIFYDVDPSEVQNQSNSFQQAFVDHEQRFTANLRRVHTWRLAMKRVANLFGWHVQHELGPQVIDDIIIKVKRRMRELVYVDVDLVGMKSRVNDVEKLLDLGSNDGVRVLGICDQKIEMHGLLQEMGREIVQLKFPSMPERWSRLWDFNDIFRVMQNDTASGVVQAIVLDLEDSQQRALRVQALSNMGNLKLLIFRNVKFCGSLKHLSNELRYVSWHQYPFPCLPSSFVPHNLIELILPDSSITNIWEGEKAPDSSIINTRAVEPKVAVWHLTDIREAARTKFLNLRREKDREAHESCITNRREGDMAFPLRNMNLSGSKNLVKLPDFKRFPNLKRLDLEGCTQLSRLDVSIAYLSILKFLNLRNCINLVSIPNHLFSLPSLKVLNLAGCSKFAYCLKFCPFEERDEREAIEQSFSHRRQKLCRQKSI
ncbi:uncharacterized protein LOC114756312 isoform X3 [Neltuma alba]|uniref:uncharacterized protein LOC114756312 isoform X3 n=1 Tax=Neltuma alba TaxID=207710 RepID=UPI0010A4B0F1|nr:uncharacterized protein LOC114756312 isoform X3 [Prosopis alba]